MTAAALTPAAARLTNQELRDALAARRSSPREPSWLTQGRARPQAGQRAQSAGGRGERSDLNILRALDQLGRPSSYTDIVDLLKQQGHPGSYTTVRKRLKELVAAGHVTRPAGAPHPVPFTLTASGRKLAR